MKTTITLVVEDDGKVIRKVEKVKKEDDLTQLLNKINEVVVEVKRLIVRVGTVGK